MSYAASATIHQFPDRKLRADGLREPDATHERLMRWFEEAERASVEAREMAEKCRDYVDGAQWTRDERETLRQRGQPDITINYCRRKISMLCGLERKARTDPKAFPRTPSEEERADAATQALRYIADDNDFQIARSHVYENMLVEGFGGIEVGLEDDGQGGADITLKHIGWERLFHDPHSRAPDFSDARYLGIVIWMDRDQLEEMYPNAGDAIEYSFSGDYGTYDDRPDTIIWTDNRRERTRVVQIHWREGGTWWTATFSTGGLLTAAEPSKFKDRRGKSACSLILQSAYMDRENRRYGMVRDLLSLQDELNKRRSKALHLLSVHQVVTEQGAVKDADAARREMAKPDGFVEVNPGMRFEILPGGDLAAGQFQLLQHATQEMNLAGPNAAMSGTDPREQSGRAILAQQAGGAVQNEPLADSLRWWARRVYEMAWMAAREFWTAGKWVRVTDSLNETRWVGINRQITVEDELAAMPEDQRQMVEMQMQLLPDDPRLQQVVRIENDITDLDADITIEEGVDIPALQMENFQTLVQLASLQPGLIPGDVLIAASSLRNKDDLLERMKEHQKQQQQQQAATAPLMQRHAMAEVASKEAKASADNALAAERRVNAAKSVHEVRADFTAPPYGESHVAPDAPSTMGEQMTPAMAMAHQLADLRAKHAKAAGDEARANDLLHSAVGRMSQVAVDHHQMTQPPAPATPRR
jgi:hypothetical protein